MPKTGQPDTSDAQVMIALYEAQAAHNLGEVMGYIWSSDFPTDFKEFRQSFPQGSNSTEERNLHRALGHFETIGTLYRNNLISEDLLFDWLAIDHLFARVKGFVLGVRKEIGQPRMFENFEYMARRNANWKPARNRPAAAAKRPAAKRPAAKRPAAKRSPAAKRARPAAAKRTRPAAKKARPVAKRTRPAAKRPAARAAQSRTTARRTAAARKRG
jgi:histone H1/5